MNRPLIRQLFGIDLRALAALRIGIGALMLANLALRIQDFTAFYTDDGCFPRSLTTAKGIYNLSGGSAWPAFLFVVTALVSLALIVGYRTWLATVLSWLLLVSLHQRQPHIINAGDHLLALLLFWSMFLPLGARASLDSRAARPHVNLHGSVLSVAGVALLFQLFAIYFFSALLKSYWDWVVTGEALYLALRLDYMTSPFGEWLANSALPDRLVTRATYWFELLGVFFAFVPWRNTAFRCLVVASFIAFHLSLIASFRIMLFPYICIVAWLIYLPPPFWDALGRRGVVRAIDRGWDAMLCALARRVDALASAHRGWPLWPVDFQANRVKQSLAGTMLLYVVWCNVSGVSSLPMPAAVDWVGSQAYLKQRWEMFAPRPSVEDGWWIAPARLDNGEEVELISGGQPSWDRPVAMRESYPSPRWRKMLGQVWDNDKRRPLAEPIADWFRRDWDAAHEPKVESLTLYFMLERTRRRPEPPIRRVVPIYRWSRDAGGELVEFNATRQSWKREEEIDRGSL